ncbi:MAG: type II toxin-antitoxin system PemK/MazF family toxin [Melioribacteraceae bacterium]|nr:type II toxin-antitoxin system PemK/MazF family toxin [Melioribacteraceae bacterium]
MVLDKDCEIIVDQIRSIDNHRFKPKIGKLNLDQINQLRRNLKIVLDI